MSRARIASLLVLLSVATFVPLMGIAMLLYPGGTWSDPTTRGHSFFTNFFCDLLHEHGLGGAPNPGARFAVTAMLSLVAGMLPFWIVVASLFASRRKRLAFATRTFGVVSVIGLVAVPLTPSDHVPALHTIAVFTASIPGLVAAACASIGLFASSSPSSPACASRLLGATGVATLVVAAIDAWLYARSLREAVTPFALPALQKVAAALLLAWMIGASFAALARERAERSREHETESA